MKNKKVIFIILFVLVLCAIAIILAASTKTNNAFDDYTEYVEEEPDMETMLNEDLIPVHERNVIESYIIENKDELISKGVPVEFFEDISITMHNSSVYTIIVGDKVLAIGLTEDGEVEYCNVF